MNGLEALRYMSLSPTNIVRIDTKLYRMFDGMVQVGSVMCDGWMACTLDINQFLDRNYDTEDDIVVPGTCPACGQAVRP